MEEVGFLFGVFSLFSCLFWGLVVGGGELIKRNKE